MCENQVAATVLVGSFSLRKQMRGQGKPRETKPPELRATAASLKQVHDLTSAQNTYINDRDFQLSQGNIAI